MSKIVNLRQARKSRARDIARKQGDENAARFGRGKLQRVSEDQEAARAQAHLDAHRVETTDD